MYADTQGKDAKEYMPDMRGCRLKFECKNNQTNVNTNSKENKGKFNMKVLYTQFVLFWGIFLPCTNYTYYTNQNQAIPTPSTCTTPLL